MSRFSRFSVIMSLMIMLVAPMVLAEGPTLMSYQGRLNDNVGDPVNATVSMVLTIYDDPTLSGAANIKWQEVQLNVTVTDGLFNVTMGDGFPVVDLLDSVFNQSDRWLGIKVGADPEISPRTQLTSVPYSHRVSTVDGASGGAISSDISVAGTIDATGMSSKIRFHYNAFGDLPNAAVYHGMIAHVHNDAKVYYAHNGNWEPLANEAHVHGGSSVGWVDDGTVVRLETTNDTVGIGTTTPTSKLEVITTVSDAASLAYGVRGVTTNSDGGGSVGGYFESAPGTGGAGFGVVGLSNTLSAIDSAFGVYGIGGNSSVGPAIGGFFNAASSGSGNKIGAYGFAENNSTSQSHGVHGKGSNSGGGGAIGGFFETTNSGSGNHYGVISTGFSNNAVPTIGIRSVAINDGSGSATAAQFETFANGIGSKVGVDANVFSSSTQLATIYQGTASTSDGLVKGLDLGIITNTGQARGLDINASSTSGTAHGAEFDVITSGPATGIELVTESSGGGIVYGIHNTVNSNTNQAYGLYSDVTSTANSIQGVWSLAEGTTSGTCRGVYGSTTNNGTGAAYGVHGVSTASGNSSSRGVYGFAINSSTGPAYGVYGSASSSGSGTHYGVYGSETSGGTGAALYASGDMVATGTKSAVVRTSRGQNLLYAMESPENWFEDFGSAQLVNGQAHVELDKLFLETVTISDQQPLRVFIQLNDDCKGTYVKVTSSGFNVFELQQGKSSASFSYRVVAKRKGFENQRLEQTDVGYWDELLYPERAEEIRAYHKNFEQPELDQDTD